MKTPKRKQLRKENVFKKCKKRNWKKIIKKKKECQKMEMRKKADKNEEDNEKMIGGK